VDLVLVVQDATTPDVAVGDRAREWLLFPLVPGVLGNRDHVLVCVEHRRRQAGVLALPGVQQAVGTGITQQLLLQGLVHAGIGLLEKLVIGLEGFRIEVAPVLVGDGGELDGLGQSLRRRVDIHLDRHGFDTLHLQG